MVSLLSLMPRCFYTLRETIFNKTGLVVRKVIGGGVVKLKLIPVVRKEIRGGVGVLKPERVQIICPAYGLQIEAVPRDGWVKGYRAVARQEVDFLIETQAGTFFLRSQNLFGKITCQII